DDAPDPAAVAVPGEVRAAQQGQLDEQRAGGDLLAVGGVDDGLPGHVVEREQQVVLEDEHASTLWRRRDPDRCRMSSPGRTARNRAGHVRAPGGARRALSPGAHLARGPPRWDSADESTCCTPPCPSLEGSSRPPPDAVAPTHRKHDMRASVTHRTTTSAGRRGLPGAAVVAAAVALAGLLPAPAAGATTQTADACESVTALVAAALPGQALDLVAALRAGSPGPTGTTSGSTTTLGTDDAPVTVEESQSPASACATEAAVAAAAVDRAEERAREAVALVPTDARAARDAADEALAVDAENGTAQRAKAAADTALAQPVAQLGGTWDAFVDRYVDPLGAPALAAALVLVVLLLLARALTGVTLYWP